MGTLRLLLAISVLIAHSTPIFGNTLVGGRVAVESFFILSGFSIALSLSSKYQNNLTNFYKNRFLKLFPLYWFFTLAVIITSFITTGKFTIFKDYIITPFSKFILILLNSSPLFTDVTNFLALNINTGQLFFTTAFRNTVPEIWNYLILPQGWTIGLEITFYFFAPWIVHQKTKILLLLGSLSLLARFIAIYYLNLNHDPWLYRFFPFEIIFFIAGIIIYRLYNNPVFHKIYFAIPVFIATIFFAY
ncbi:MAG: acyltransferase family protein, partial [bacterium]|nr:acyltransferase family protein [bacterium]